MQRNHAVLWVAEWRDCNLLALKMRWIRSPLWDCFWIWSGLPIGLVLMLFAPGMVPSLVVAAMVLETAHVVSPMVLAWTRPELRAIVSREWAKHIVGPIMVMCGVLIAPATWVAGLYWSWNIYHFGMQNFGVASLYGIGRDRTLRALVCAGGTALGIGVLPFLFPDPRVNMLCLGVFSFNHWLVDIGLSSRVARWHWGFVALVLLVGIAWLLLRNGPLSVRLVPQIIVIRYGIGIIHFIYSARIWTLSDPHVYRLIGRQIFGLDTSIQPKPVPEHRRARRIAPRTTMP
jgi:hypothetical protein